MVDVLVCVDFKCSEFPDSWNVVERFCFVTFHKWRKRICVELLKVFCDV